MGPDTLNENELLGRRGVHRGRPALLLWRRKGHQQKQLWDTNISFAQKKNVIHIHNYMMNA